jgi:hypothetical protein
MGETASAPVLAEAIGEFHDSSPETRCLLDCSTFIGPFSKRRRPGAGWDPVPWRLSFAVIPA